MLLVQSGTRTGGVGNNGTAGDCPNHSIVEIGQNTEKSLGDLSRLCCLSNSSGKPSTNADVKNSQGVK